MKIKVVVSKMQSFAGDIEFQNAEELNAHLETISNDDFVTIEFRQVVPNPKAQEKTIASVTARLRGHSKKTNIKDEKNLVNYVNFAKESAQDFEFEIGKEFDGVTLQESYVPIFKLNDDFCLDKLGNVVAKPVIRPFTNEVILYSFGSESFPIFKQIKLIIGEYIPHNFDLENRKTSYIPNFQGEEKLATGRKTPEYQKWLNNLYNQYMNPEEASFSKREMVFETAE